MKERMGDERVHTWMWQPRKRQRLHLLTKPTQLQEVNKLMMILKRNIHHFYGVPPQECLTKENKQITDAENEKHQLIFLEESHYFC